MLRLYDFACDQCNVTEEHLVKSADPQPRTEADILCPSCNGLMERCLVTITAKYLQDRPHSPMCMGGTYDTAGYKSLPKVDEFKGETASDFKDHINTKEHKRQVAERARVREQNKLKRQRAACIRRGDNIDIRHHKLPGDPKI